MADSLTSASASNNDTRAADLARDKRRIGVLLPDIDPGDLDLILTSLARPFGSGRHFFLREISPGVRIF